MRLFRVIAHGPYNSALSTSDGYPTREAAARVAAGIAESGQAPHGVSVEPYEAEDEAKDES